MSQRKRSRTTLVTTELNHYLAEQIIKLLILYTLVVEIQWCQISSLCNKLEGIFWPSQSPLSLLNLLSALVGDYLIPTGVNYIILLLKL
ncbi:hypothetical protein LINPERPRIM_LOCUS4866 [Linum perenne]